MNYDIDKFFDISIIVPLYYGKIYINQIISMINNNARNASDLKIELLFVNDSPEQKVVIDDRYDLFAISLINNNTNLGIHQSRINGINNARGEYIFMLDQDDIISDNYIKEQYVVAKKYGTSVCNGYFDDANGKLYVLYRNNFTMTLVNNIFDYFKNDCKIRSIGQLMIKKNLIPIEWYENILKLNGPDDYFLYLLLLSKGIRFGLNNKKLFFHKYTTKNTSLNSKNMINAVRLMYERFFYVRSEYAKYKKLSDKQLNIRDRYVKYYNLKGTIIFYLKNIDILVYAIRAKLICKKVNAEHEKFEDCFKILD